ncbi:MAG: hypothetical protein WAO35_15475 [Terriglobia bacterium]
MAIIYAPSQASARRKAADMGKHDRATYYDLTQVHADRIKVKRLGWTAATRRYFA